MNAPVKLTAAHRRISCGCCTGGRACWNHRDESRGIPAQPCTDADDACIQSVIENVGAACAALAASKPADG